MHTLKIKPISVNACWKGKRFKTPEYNAYEKEVLFRLPLMKLPDAPYQITYEFGVSNIISDVDNPIKPFQDILSKKYGFNDSSIHKITATKIKVAKGNEYVSFNIETLKQ